jgi:hypothetical protein
VEEKNEFKRGEHKYIVVKLDTHAQPKLQLSEGGGGGGGELEGLPI